MLRGCFFELGAGGWATWMEWLTHIQIAVPRIQLVFGGDPVAWKDRFRNSPKEALPATIANSWCPGISWACDHQCIVEPRCHRLVRVLWLALLPCVDLGSTGYAAKVVKEHGFVGGSFVFAWQFFLFKIPRIILEPESGVTVVCAVFVASVMCNLLFAKYLQAFGAKNLSFVWYLHESHGGIMVVAFYSWNLSCAWYLRHFGLRILLLLWFDAGSCLS